VDSFVVGLVLVGTVPIIFTARAWWISHHDSSSNSGHLVRFVLYLNSASALLFVVVVLLDALQRMPLESMSRIAVPTFYLCICITVLSGIKIRRPLYRAVFFSSGIMSIGWLIIGSLH
jgi:hypothetical protein